MISWNARFTTVAVLLAGTALFLQARAARLFQISLASFSSSIKKLGRR